jgi:hypothetical protein
MSKNNHLISNVQYETTLYFNHQIFSLPVDMESALLKGNGAVTNSIAPPLR